MRAAIRSPRRRDRVVQAELIGIDKRGRRHFHSIPWGDIPAWPFLGISDEDEDALMAAIEKWIGG